MKVVIFAAGKGTRFGKLTKKIPKPLIKLNKKPVLKYVLAALPDKISEIIIIIGYLGNQIKNYFGDNSNKKRIFYIQQKKLNGTAAALRLAKPRLGKEKFLVLNADDIYQKSDLEHLISRSLAFGICKKKPGNNHFYNVKLSKNKTVKNFEKQTNQKSKKILMATGAYVLDKKIFRYKPIKIKNNTEYGLPQTIIKMAKKYPIRAVFMKFWQPINTPADLKKAKKLFVSEKKQSGRGDKN